ncbi:MAG: hypothetical protein ACN4EU_05590 [Brevundimonas mediterranea]
MLIIAALAAVAVTAIALERGQKAEERDNALAKACAAVSASDNEEASCVARMDRAYRGDLSTDRTINAAAEQVRQMREAGWR